MKILYIKIIKVFILLIALVFIFVGISKNENKDVLKKASIICLECIGVG